MDEHDERSRGIYDVDDNNFQYTKEDKAFATEENFNDLARGENYENIIIVDQNSEIKTIQMAIDSAKPKTTIKIKKGIYRESLVIKTPYLDIESEDPVDQAIIISNNKPTLKVIGLKSTESIRIANLKLTNRGIFSETQEESDYTKL